MYNGDKAMLTIISSITWHTLIRVLDKVDLIKTPFRSISSSVILFMKIILVKSKKKIKGVVKKYENLIKFEQPVSICHDTEIGSGTRTLLPYSSLVWA